MKLILALLLFIGSVAAMDNGSVVGSDTDTSSISSMTDTVSTGR